MLILTRNKSQTIVIDDNIKITILGVSGMQVRIGIEAPDHITVHRQEIWHRIRDEKDGQGK